MIEGNRELDRVVVGQAFVCGRRGSRARGVLRGAHVPVKSTSASVFAFASIASVSGMIFRIEFFTVQRII